jgi:putative transposase
MVINKHRTVWGVMTMCRVLNVARANNLAPSMNRRGNCRDNAVAESFFSSLKKERIRKRIYKTRDLARADIFDYIEVFYNRARRRQSGGL